MKIEGRSCRGIWWGLAVALQLGPLGGAGCGGGGSGESADPTPPPPDNAKPWEGPPAAYVRVDVARAANALQIQSASRLTTPPMVQPLGGEMLAVARSYDGTILDATPVLLDTTMRSARLDGHDGLIESEEEGDPASASTTVFLKDDPGLDRIEILAASGAVAATLAADDIEPVTLALSSSPDPDLARIQSTFPWVRLLMPADTKLLPKKLAAVTADLVEPNAEQLDLVNQCLAQMSSASRHAVHNIAIAIFPNHGLTMLGGGECQVLKGDSDQSTMLLNADMNHPDVVQCLGSSKERRFINTCVHEGAHIFAMLTGAQATGADTSDWPADGRKIVQEKAQSYALSEGLEPLFSELQQNAISVAAQTHAIAYGQVASDAVAVPGGFATRVGATDEREDVAYYASEIQAPNVSPGAEAPICQMFGDAGKLTAATAIQYSKALLLRNIGLVDGASFDRCTHGIGIDAPTGISAPSSDFQFSSNLDFGYFDLDGSRMFGVSGNGLDDNQAMLRVKVTGGKPPVGLHRLQHVTMDAVDKAVNGFLLANDNPLKARTSTGGLALIAEISPHVTSGAIFFLSLGDLGIGLLSRQTFPLVTFRASH